MLEYHVSARRIDSHGSEASTKEARIVLDTDMAGRPDAFNPAEMLLASLAACMLKAPSALCRCWTSTCAAWRFRFKASARTARPGWRGSTMRSSLTPTRAISGSICD